MSSEAREAVLSAAGEIFGRFGFKKASVEDIARLAGIGKGTVYLHFESKEALFEAVLRQSLTQAAVELHRRVERAETPEAKLKAFFEGKVARALQVANQGALSAEHALEMAKAGKRVVAEFQERDIDLVTSILKAGRDAGAFHASDLKTIGHGLLDLIQGATGKVLAGDSTYDARRSLDAIFGLILRGLATRPPRG
ncbi:TetR/AcrR family transcriptional regulator [Cystobacter fuscus]|uniref:TetR/AcrR family transcriptional regulator n=1 Tax=Cystobacter fuscus TaxID=43 RepID=UPI002B2FDA36|nr:TetR/AcrR family transcriptional regulator [Cystobacter fuscus]